MWQPPRKNVFLDFLSTENNAIYGAYANYPRTRHVQCLTESLNVAVLLCGECCILPPFFPLTCSNVRAALFAKSGLFSVGLIRFPLREVELAEFVDKKRREYDAVRDHYPGLSSTAGERFLLQHSSAVIRRSATLGENIAANWEAGPDGSPPWEPLKKTLTARDIDILRKVPRRLKGEGKSITYAAIRERMPGVSAIATDVNIALQYDYTGIYLQEYDATVVSRMPPKTTDLGLRPHNLSYDYICFRDVLAVLELWRLVPQASALTIIAFRLRHGYTSFLHRFEQVCLLLNRVDRVVGHFSEVAYRIPKELRQALRGLSRGDGVEGLAVEPTPAELDAIEEYLVAAVNSSQAVADEQPTGERIPHGIRRTTEGVKMHKVFVIHGHDIPLRNEIELFLRENNLEPVVMARGAMVSQTLPEKFERMAADCDYAVVIATPDDRFLDAKSNKAVSRFRQNVVLEIGYFWGRLGRAGKFSILVREDPSLDLPSDLQGLGWIPITKDLGETKLRLLKDLSRANIL